MWASGQHTAVNRVTTFEYDSFVFMDLVFFGFHDFVPFPSKSKSKEYRIMCTKFPGKLRNSMNPH